MNGFRAFALALLTVFAAAGGAQAASSVEVVQSVPIETTLEVPGIRLTQTVWLEMINAAQSTIDLEQFYVSSQAGQSLAPVLTALRAAAARGVQIRLLIDSGYYKTYPNDPNDLAQVSGIQVKTIDYSAQGGIQHSKYFVVDQASSFVGSANFDWLALTHIHEVGLRVSDVSIAQGLESVFVKDWNDGVALSRTAGPASSLTAPQTLEQRLGLTDGGTVLNLVASPASRNPVGVPDSLSAVTQLMGTARSTLKIQVYEYTTKPYHGSGHWTVLDAAIRQAAARGVHVQLMVDAVALKTGKADLKALAALQNIEVRTVTIPQWSGGAIPYARLIHSKYFVVDDSSAWVGTENWSMDYFTSSRNVGFTLQSAELNAELGQIFDRVWGSAYTSTL